MLLSYLLAFQQTNLKWALPQELRIPAEYRKFLCKEKKLVNLRTHINRKGLITTHCSNKKPNDLV